MIAYELLVRKTVIHRTVSARRIFVQPPPFPAEIRERFLDSHREDILRLQDLIGGEHSPAWMARGQAQAADAV
jgi:hypothetical protein